MAQHEADREDLLREATALVRRIELRAPRWLGDTEIFIGFRRSGAATVFLRQDEVYQFTSAGELRRAYVAGHLYKAVRRGLVRMTRVRTPTETQLCSTPLEPAKISDLLTEAHEHLAALVGALRSEDVDVVGHVPPTEPLLAEVTTWLTQLLAEPLRIAISPHAR